MTITLNGDRFEIVRPLTVTDLLEHNLFVLKRDAFDRTVIREGDSVEIVNFVGGG